MGSLTAYFDCPQPQEKKVRFLEAWLRFLEYLGSKQPLVLFLDDIQWYLSILLSSLIMIKGRLRYT